MANHPSYIQKSLVMKPEVAKIFDDLEEWRDHCRFNLLKFDEKDLYRSKEYKEWQRDRNKATRHYRKDHRSSQENVH